MSHLLSNNLNVNNGDIERLILPQKIIILIFCSVFTIAVPFTYFIFLGQGPSDYLKMVIIIGASNGVIIYLTRVISHSLLVVLPKEEARFSSAFSMAIFLLAVLSLILFLLKDLFLYLYEIDYALAHSYYQLALIAVLLMGVNTVLNYYLIFKEQYISVLKVNAFTFLVRLIGNILCLYWLAGDERVMGYAWVFVISAVLTLVYFGYYLKSFLSLRDFYWVNPLHYFSRAKNILLGDGIVIVLAITAPALIKFVLVKYNYDAYIVVFGVTATIFGFMAIPNGMLGVYVVPLLSKYRQDNVRLRALIGQIKVFIWKFNIYPALLVLLICLIFLKQFWQLNFFPVGIFLLLKTLVFLINCIELPYGAFNRACENQMFLARVSMFINGTDLVLVLLLAHFELFNLYGYAALLGLVNIISYLLIKGEAKKQLLMLNN